jgi:hypothetical protein
VRAKSISEKNTKKKKEAHTVNLKNAFLKQSATGGFTA